MRKKNILIIIIIIFQIILSTISFANDIEEELDSSQIEQIIQTSSQNIKSININSNSAIIYQRNSKRVIWEKNGYKKVPMASTTKIMTAIIVIENAKLEEMVEVSKTAASVGGSRLGLKTGDKISVNDLLYGLMLPSGNDAALALAQHIGGSVEEFINLMNIKAKRLGLKNTNFVTPHGLDSPEHYTTPYELALITDYALNIKKLSEIVSTKTYTVNINKNSKTITNTNELLGYLEGVNGVKTGFTNGAGRCLVTSVNNENNNIICIVLGADTKKNRTIDSIKLINYFNQNYKEKDLKQNIIDEFEKWNTENKISVLEGRKQTLKVKLEEIKKSKYMVNINKENVQIEISILNEIRAPVSKEQVVGKLKIYIDNTLVDELHIKSEEDIQEKKFIDYVKDFFRKLF